MLKELFPNLNILNLAGFSHSQQRGFIENWYGKWTGDKEYSKSLADDFMKELERAGDLKKLAEIPLLLSILIVQKMQDSELPKNKLEALKEITQYLIKKHPVKRVKDAGIVQEDAIDIDFKDVFCELAINVQQDSNDRVISKDDAHKIIENYLIKYAGYDKSRAKSHSKKLIEIGANSFGIIIEKSNDEIAFGHKQFQEFLAAQQLFESDESLANDFIKKYAANPTSHQVIISFFGLIPLKQMEKFKKHFEALKGAVCEKFQEDYLRLISYEVAINLDNAPSEIMNKSFDSIIYSFEYETDPTYKEALLKRILGALQNGKLKDKVQDFLIQFFPNQYKYVDYRINSLRNVKQLSQVQFEFLQKSFINGTIKSRYDTSYIFIKHIKNDKVFNFIKDVITNCSNPDILAFAINSIITNGIAEFERDELIKSISVDIPIVQLYLFKHKIFSKRHTQEDLSLILPLVNKMPYQLKQEIINLLIDGFDKIEALKEVLIKSVSKIKSYGENGITIDNEIAWKVLFHSFNKDAEVINLVKYEFENEEYPLNLGGHEMFQHLVHYFKGNDELITSLDYWLNNRLKKHNYVNPEYAFISILVRSEYAKNTLLQDLPNTGFSHWNIMALLDGWSDDMGVKEKLKNYFRTVDTNKKSASAHFISKVFDSNEKDEAIKILEQILFDREAIFRERAIFPFVEIDKGYFEYNLLERLINDLESFPKDELDRYYTAIGIIVQNFHSNKMVQDYVLERIENDNRLYGLCIQYYPTLIKIESQLLKKSSPLSKELRLLIIKFFSDLSKLPNKIEALLSDFETESEEDIMANMAICLFNQIKKDNANKIIELSKPLTFARGFEYVTKRNIAFIGFLVTKKLDQYFSNINDENPNEKPSMGGVFDEYHQSKYSNNIIIRTIINNFDYFISYTKKDFSAISKWANESKNIESIWGAFAKYSSKSSPTYSYIMGFVEENITKIKNSSIISFLNRTVPNT